VFVSRRLLGVRVDDVTYSEALALCRRAIEAGGFHQLVTVNTEMLMLARRDEELYHIIESAYLALPDGAGLLLAGRLLREPLRERVTGVDFAPHLARLAAETGQSLYLLGAAPGVAEQAACRLQGLAPGLHVAGCYAGTPLPAEASWIISLLRRAKADILLVAFGVPAEEKWIARNAPAAGVKLAMGVGGAFDFLAGAVPRAPQWMRDHGLEWLYRLCHQPWRWRRMLALPRFLALVFALRARRLLRLPEHRGDA